MATSIARDALHVVLSFLSLRETALAGRTCVAWRTAVSTEPPKRWECRLALAELDHLAKIVASTLVRRHVTTLAHCDEKKFLRVAIADLVLLRALPRLTRLTTQLQLRPGDDDEEDADYVAAIGLPSTLRHVRLVWSSSEQTPAAAARIVRSVVAAPGLESIDFAFGGFNPVRIDLALLQQLPKLTDLKHTFLLTLPQVTVLRSLSGLRALSATHGWGADNFRALLAPGHSLQQLEMLDARHTWLTVELMELLASLPLLTSLQPTPWMTGADPQVLGSLHLLPQLQGIRLIFRGHELTLDSDSPPLIPHGHLRALALERLDISESTCGILFVSLPQLRELELFRMPIESLAPLLILPELHTLSVGLASSSCDHEDSYPCMVEDGCTLRHDLKDHVRVLERLPHLTSLTIRSLGRTRVVASVLNQLRVPSARMPQLMRFACSDEVEYLAQAQAKAVSKATQTIARDALHCVLAFLDLASTTSAGGTCRFWRSAMESEPPKSDCRIALDHLRSFPTILASPLRRHITTISHASGQSDGDDRLILQDGAEVDERLHCNSSDLTLMGQLPRLTRLVAQVQVLTGDGVFHIPCTIQHAVLCFCGPPLAIYCALHSLLPAAECLASVALSFGLGPDGTEVDLTPLHDLPRLTALTLELMPTDSLIDSVRSLAGLRRLRVTGGQWTMPRLERLCAHGHALQQLELLDMGEMKLSVEKMELLSSLPSLTAVHRRDDCLKMDMAAMSQLHLLPRLQRIFASVMDGTAATGTDPLVPHSSLRDFELYGCFSSATLERLLASMPHLRVLTLWLTDPESLQPLIVLQELHTLRISFASRNCTHKVKFHCSTALGCKMRGDLEDLCKVFDQLPSLTSLELRHLSCTHVTVESLDRLRVPSLRLPRLRRFVVLPILLERMANSLANQ